jgi:hypothetical protein
VSDGWLKVAAVAALIGLAGMSAALYGVLSLLGRHECRIYALETAQNTNDSDSHPFG